MKQATLFTRVLEAGVLLIALALLYAVAFMVALGYPSEARYGDAEWPTVVRDGLPGTGLGHLARGTV